MSHFVYSLPDDITSVMSHFVYSLPDDITSVMSHFVYSLPDDITSIMSHFVKHDSSTCKVIHVKHDVNTKYVTTLMLTMSHHGVHDVSIHWVV